MTSLLQDQHGVSTSGEHWDIDVYRLWSGAEPDTIVYAGTRPGLMKNGDNGRWQASLTLLRKWQNGEYVITGGTAILSIGAGAGLDLREFTNTTNRWRNILLNRGYKRASVATFVPLPTRNAKLQLSIDPASGRLSPGSTIEQSGGVSGSNSVLLELTGVGASKWSRGIKTNDRITGTVRITYEYPRLMPDATAHVVVKGQRVYLHLSQVLHTSNDVVYGSDAEVKSAWDEMFAEGDIAITTSGSLPPDLESKRQELLNTFANQAREQLFDRLFEPMEATQAVSTGSSAAATTTTGITTKYALKWRKRSDATDFNFSLKFDAWNWLEDSMETDINTMTDPLDESYISTVFAEVSVPVSVMVEPDPHLSGVSVSLTFSEGHSPESAVFGNAGGTAEYVVSSSKPDLLKVTYKAQISFAHPQWPVMEASGTGTVAEGGNRITIKPGSWVRRHTVYVYIRDGNRIKRPEEVSPNDYLVLTVVCRRGNGLPTVKESARVTPLAPVELSYPADPNSLPAVSVTVLGIVDGVTLRSQELQIDSAEKAIFVLAGKDGVQLVSKQSLISEDDALAQRLQESGAKPVVTPGGAQSGAPVNESGGSISMVYDLELVPQPTPVSCWVASLAMVIGFRDGSSYDPAVIASVAGMDLDTGYGWNDIRNAVRAWNLREEGPASGMPELWAGLLRDYGPIWIVEVGAPYHAVVLAGIQGDSTPDGTRVTVYNPWPPNQGAIEFKKFLDFDSEFGLGAGASAAIVHR